MLDYSDKALVARLDFLDPYNDITIVVEDRGKENFYTQIMTNLLGRDVKIGIVPAVSGKQQVLKLATEFQSNPKPKKRFFLVDGDFDEILGRPTLTSIYFYRLRRYDIESYLIEEAAVCIVASEESPKFTESDFRAKLNIDTWIADVIDTSIRMAACAAVLQHIGVPQARAFRSIERYCSGNSALPDRSKIESSIQEISAEQSEMPPEEFIRLLEQTIARMGSSNADRHRWISGKNIFMPLLIRLLRQHGSRQLTTESLSFRLAKNCEYPDLLELRERILQAINEVTPPVDE